MFDMATTIRASNIDMPLFHTAYTFVITFDERFFLTAVFVCAAA
jgi:hypothetical protein